METAPLERMSVCPLYKLGLSIRNDTALAVRYLMPTGNNTGNLDEAGIYIDLTSAGATERLRKYLAFEHHRDGKWYELAIASLPDKLQAKAKFQGSQIVELGVYCKYPAEDHPLERPGVSADQTQSTGTNQAPFVYLGEISLSADMPLPYRINSISTNVTASGLTRLSWNIAADADVDVVPALGPFSGTTGPFAYFVVYFDGEMQGLAFATEYIVSKPFIGQGNDPGYSVDGVMWNGKIIASS